MSKRQNLIDEIEYTRRIIDEAENRPTDNPLLLDAIDRHKADLRRMESELAKLPEEAGEKQRTLAQNRALHMFFAMLADALNDSGYEMRKSFEKMNEGFDVPWTPETIKECLWRPIQQAQLRKESTTQLTRKEIDKVYETLNRALSEKFGVSVEFPNIERVLQETSKESG